MASILSTGCGSVGEPMYPALKIPSRVTDLAAIELGDKIAVRFTIPPLTTEGLPLKDIASVELRIGPNIESEFNPDAWAPNVRRVDVPAPKAPGMVEASTPVAGFIGNQVVVTVRVSNSRGRFSPWSPPVNVTVEQPLPTPTAVRAEAIPEGVRVAWTAAPNENAFRIYRKVAPEKDASLLATSGKPEYIDTTTEYGKSYEYFVQATHEQNGSDIAAANAITPIDTFAPRVPTGLTASVGVGAVELAWERNTESDFKQYRIYRSEEGGPFVKIAEGLDSPNYSDRTVAAGKHYQYQITAADVNNNESKPSDPVEANVP